MKENINFFLNISFFYPHQKNMPHFFYNPHKKKKNLKKISGGQNKYYNRSTLTLEFKFGGDQVDILHGNKYMLNKLLYIIVKRHR